MSDTKLRQFDRVRIKGLSMRTMSGIVVTTMIDGVVGHCLVAHTTDISSDECLYTDRHHIAELEFISRPERTSDGRRVKQA